MISKKDNRGKKIKKKKSNEKLKTQKVKSRNRQTRRDKKNNSVVMLT